MTDLEELVRNTALDYGKPSGIIILVGETTTHIGIHGLTNEAALAVLAYTSDYIKSRINSTPTGHTIIRRD